MGDAASDKPDLSPVPAVSSTPPAPEEPAKPAGPQPDPATAEGYYQAYAEYSRTLRTWLVAYGVGAPALFVASDGTLRAIKDSGQGAEVTTLFLLGVSLQVLLAIANKLAMWGLYFGHLWPEFQKTRRFRACMSFSEWLFVDAVLDVLSMLLFAAATIRVLRILA